MKKTQHELVLDKFVRDGVDQSWMNRPYKIEGYAYAVDGYAMACIPVGFCPNVKANKEAKLIAMPVQENQLEIPIGVLAILFHSGEMQDETTSTPCKTCEGTGEVEWEFKHYSKDDDCPACDGHGNFKRKTGRQIPNPNRRVKIGSQHFKMNQISRLNDVANFLKVDKIQVTNCPDKSCGVFSIGDVEVMVMHLTPSEHCEFEVLGLEAEIS